MKMVTIIMPEILLEKIDKKRQELGISRSEYLRSLVIKEFEKEKADKNAKAV
jgi:metal-responsive CopG/Arc/MetJ family transcriptional regulator